MRTHHPMVLLAFLLCACSSAPPGPGDAGNRALNAVNPIFISVSRPYTYLNLEIYSDSLVKNQWDKDSVVIEYRDATHDPRRALPFIDTLVGLLGELPSFTFVNEQSLADSYKIQVRSGDKRIVCYECMGDTGEIPVDSLDPVIVDKMKRVKAYLKIAFNMQNEPMM